MTPEKVIKLAKQSGFCKNILLTWICTTEDIQAFARLIRDAELEEIPYTGSAAPATNVPLLTQDDIVQIILSSKHLPLGEAIRLTEKVVRQKAGL